jgi:hypothetical protein
MTRTLAALPADRHPNLTLAIAVALALGNTLPAVAADHASGDSTGEIEEIVVTANRPRAECIGRTVQHFNRGRPSP